MGRFADDPIGRYARHYGYPALTSFSNAVILGKSKLGIPENFFNPRPRMV